MAEGAGQWNAVKDHFADIDGSASYKAPSFLRLVLEVDKIRKRCYGVIAVIHGFKGSNLTETGN
jgi:hypothetical protein